MHSICLLSHTCILGGFRLHSSLCFLKKYKIICSIVAIYLPVANLSFSLFLVATVVGGVFVAVVVAVAVAVAWSPTKRDLLGPILWHSADCMAREDAAHPTPTHGV